MQWSSVTVRRQKEKIKLFVAVVVVSHWALWTMRGIEICGLLSSHTCNSVDKLKYLLFYVMVFVFFYVTNFHEFWIEFQEEKRDFTNGCSNTLCVVASFAYKKEQNKCVHVNQLIIDHKAKQQNNKRVQIIGWLAQWLIKAIIVWSVKCHVSFVTMLIIFNVHIDIATTIMLHALNNNNKKLRNKNNILLLLPNIVVIKRVDRFGRVKQLNLTMVTSETFLSNLFLTWTKKVIFSEQNFNSDFLFAILNWRKIEIFHEKSSFKLQFIIRVCFAYLKRNQWPQLCYGSDDSEMLTQIWFTKWNSLYCFSCSIACNSPLINDESSSSSHYLLIRRFPFFSRQANAVFLLLRAQWKQ